MNEKSPNSDLSPLRVYFDLSTCTPAVKGPCGTVNSAQREYPPLRPLTAHERQLVTDNAALAYELAKRYSFGKFGRLGVRRVRQLMGDISQLSLIGLCIAAQRYNPAEGKAKFSTVAWMWIRSEVSAHAHLMTLRVGREQHIRKNVRTMGSVCPDAYDPASFAAFSLIDNADDRNREDLIDAACRTLDPQRALVIRRLMRGEKWEAVTTELRVSKQRVQQLRETALARLRNNKRFMALAGDLLAERQRIESIERRAVKCGAARKVA